MKVGDLVMHRYWSRIRSPGVVVGTGKSPGGFNSFLVLFEGELHNVMGYNLIKVEDDGTFL